jgi:hypothetical protein
MEDRGTIKGKLKIGKSNTQERVTGRCKNGFE